MLGRGGLPETPVPEPPADLRPHPFLIRAHWSAVAQRMHARRALLAEHVRARGR